MEFNQVKRLASAVFGCGVNKVKIVDSAKASQAMTKDDVRALIHQGAVVRKPARGTSRVRARKIAVQKKKGLRKGSGSRHGTKKTRTPKKQKWMKKVRALRRKLLTFKEKIGSKNYRKLYNMIKGGYFRDKRHLELYMEEKGILKKKDKT